MNSSGPAADRLAESTRPAHAPLLVTSSYAPHFGGVEEVVARLATGLSAQGPPPVVVTNRWPKELAREEEIDGIAVVRRAFRTPVGGPRQVGTWLVGSGVTKRAIRRSARSMGCTVVNVHCVSSNAEYVLDVSEALDIPIVVSLHGELTADATGAYDHPRQRRLWAELLDRAAVVTAPSEYVLRTAEAVYGRSLAERSRVVRNGVEVGHRARGPAPRSGVLAAGRFVPVKGFDVLIRAWADVVRDHPAHTLTIAGDGPQRHDLEGLVRELDLRDSVEFPGRLQRAQLHERFRAAAAVVVPSREEALGLVALEAMAAGAPVVATDAGGLPEIVIPDRTGFLVGGDDVPALAAGVSAALRGGPQVAAQTAGARALAGALSWESFTDQMRACYERAVGG